VGHFACFRVKVPPKNQHVERAKDFLRDQTWKQQQGDGSRLVDVLAVVQVPCQQQRLHSGAPRSVVHDVGNIVAVMEELLER
jgi:hypothetical protein